MEDVYINEVVHDLIEHRFLTVPGVTAAELHAALASGLAEVSGYEVIGPDKVKMADVKAYRRTPQPHTSTWILLDADDQPPHPTPQAAPVGTAVPRETRGCDH